MKETLIVFAVGVGASLVYEGFKKITGVEARLFQRRCKIFDAEVVRINSTKSA